MKQQIIKTSYFLFILILFVQMNYLSLSAQTPGESLYKRLGGVYNIAAVIDDFVERLLSDPVIIANTNVANAIGKITKPGLKYQLTELLCQAAGGPQKYNGRSMKESHQGLNITEVEWQTMMKDFLTTLTKFNLKNSEQNELLVIVGNTKNDIVAPLPSAPAPPNPANAPLAIPSTTIQNPTPTSPKIPETPKLPNPENVVQPSAEPSIPVQPSNVPSLVAPEPATGLPSLPQAPAPNNVEPPQPVEKLPSLPEPVTPPSTEDPIPKLDQPSNPQPDTVPQTEPETTTSVPQDAPAVHDTELPPEPILEPAE